MKMTKQVISKRKEEENNTPLTKGELMLSRLRGKGSLRISTDKILEATRGRKHTVTCGFKNEHK